MVTAVVAIFNVVVFFIAKSTDLFSPPAIVLSKLYTNSLLVQLNFRMRIIGSRDEIGDDGMHDLTHLVKSDSRSPTSTKSHQQSLVIPNRSANSSVNTKVGKFIPLSVLTEREDLVRYFKNLGDWVATNCDLN